MGARPGGVDLNTIGASLCDAELARFWEQAFLIPQFRFSPDDVAAMRAGIMR